MARTIAEEVVTRCSNATAYTLTHGYAFHDFGTPLEKTVRFPSGTIRAERRNAEGRTTYMRLEYNDGSGIELKWHPATGVRLEVSKPKRTHNSKENPNG